MLKLRFKSKFKAWHPGTVRNCTVDNNQQNLFWCKQVDIDIALNQIEGTFVYDRNYSDCAGTRKTNFLNKSNFLSNLINVNNFTQWNG